MANPAYLELIDFLVSGVAPEALLAFRRSEAAQALTKAQVRRKLQVGV